MRLFLRDYFASLLKEGEKYFQRRIMFHRRRMVGGWRERYQRERERCKDFTLLRVKYAQYTGYYVDKFQRREQAHVSEVAN